MGGGSERGRGDDELLILAVESRCRRRARHTPRRRRWLLLLAPPLLLLVALAAAVVAGALAGPSFVASRCSLSSLQPVTLGQNSFVYASDGSFLGVIPSAQNRQPLPLGHISSWLVKGTIAIEDRRFWQHGALDYRGILRAAAKDVAAGRPVQGGSTITQQLARTLYLGTHERSLERKLHEACLAMKLSKRWSKKRILTSYLNVIYLGNHAFGAEAAAQTYYSRHASELTLPQAALIAGLAQAPSAYDPFRRPYAARARRNEVLRAMLVGGYISYAEYRWAVHSRIKLEPGSIYQTIHQPYFFGYVEDQLIARFGEQAVRGGGLQVHTTIDPRLQEVAGNAIRSVLRSRDDPSAALVAIDPTNGAVRAMGVVVPSGQRLDFNLATQGHRQAGSAFKPFVLATAIEQGYSLFSTLSGPSELTIDDPRCNNGYERDWEVHNYADESGGTMDLLHATAHSVNTIFAQLVTAVGPDKVVRMAHRLGIQSLLKPVCSITLGTQAVSPLEMTNAYATLAARGVRFDARALNWVRSASGQRLPVTGATGRRAIAADKTDVVTYALESVVEWGTGTAARLDRPVAGKTGTAEDFQDAWFCGYVPQLVACVWVGYPHAEVPMHGVEGFADVFGGSLPAEIWHAFMAPAVAALPKRDFVHPSLSGGRYVSPAEYH